MVLIYIILFLLGIFIFIILFDISREWVKLKSFNHSPLDIKTFDGKDSPYHPSVIYFDVPYNGFKFWMVETPFYLGGKPYVDRWECPSIHVSNDGIHWSDIENCHNPIDNLTDKEIDNLDYFSDPHLVINGNYLECWYRLTKRRGVVTNVDDVFLLRKITCDGINWSEKQTIADLKNNSSEKGLGKMVVSPSLIYYDNIYYMYYVDRLTENREVVFSSSDDAIIWSDKCKCNLLGPSINPWHIDVSKINSIYWMIIYDYDSLSLWKSENGIDFYFIKILLTPSNTIGSFYKRDLYRACLVKANDVFRLYFSADDGYKTYIGVMEGKSPEYLKIVSPDNKQFSSFSFFIYKYFKYRLRALRFIITHSKICHY